MRIVYSCSESSTARPSLWLQGPLQFHSQNRDRGPELGYQTRLRQPEVASDSAWTRWQTHSRFAMRVKRISVCNQQSALLLATQHVPLYPTVPHSSIGSLRLTPDDKRRLNQTPGGREMISAPRGNTRILVPSSLGDKKRREFPKPSHCSEGEMTTIEALTNFQGINSAARNEG